MVIFGEMYYWFTIWMCFKMYWSTILQTKCTWVKVKLQILKVTLKSRSILKSYSITVMQVNVIHYFPPLHRTAYAVCVQWIFSKIVFTESYRVDELLNKVVIFIFFAYNKYSHRFITFRLNPWWQMDYLDDVFHTFLDLDSVNCLAVNGTVKSLPVLIQKINNCVRPNKAFTGLERHGGKWLMKKISFWGGVTLSRFHT